MDFSFYDLIFIIFIPAYSVLAQVMVRKKATGELQIAVERFFGLAFSFTILALFANIGDLLVEGQPLPARLSPMSTFMFINNLIMGFIFAAIPLSAAHSGLKIIRSAKTEYVQKNLKLAVLLLSLAGASLLFLYSLKTSPYYHILFFLAGAVIGILRGFLPRPAPREKIADGKIFLDRPFSENWFRRRCNSYPRVLLFVAASWLVARNVLLSPFAWALPVVGYFLALYLFSFGWFYRYEKRNNVRLQIGYVDPDQPADLPAI
jgi:hypothetical protein